MLLLDGLYANGPVMALARRNNWEFMIVLKDDALSTVWEEFEGLQKLAEPTQKLEQKWANRSQSFRWSNEITYEFGKNGKQRQQVHVVVCEERWPEIEQGGTKEIEKRSRHAWLSSKRLSQKNVHERCNLGARHRWGIENGFLVEKHQGYEFEHCYSFNWVAMKGYHYLMRLAVLLNVLSQFSESLATFVKQYGKQGLIEFLRETLMGPWLEPTFIKERLAKPGGLRLI